MPAMADQDPPLLGEVAAAQRMTVGACLCPCSQSMPPPTHLRWATSPRRGGFGLALVLALTACAPSKLAYGQVKSAMIDAGLSERNSSCMATRLTDRLSLLQLNKLRKLKGEKRTLFDYVSAVRNVGDAEAIEVTASSAALCASGLAAEKR